MDQKTKPWAFPKPHPENTLAANATSKSSMLRQTPETRAQGASEGKRPARRHRTLIVRARHHASRAGRGIRSPGSHPPRRPAVRQAPRTRPHLLLPTRRRASVGARLRACPSPTTRENDAADPARRIDLGRERRPAPRRRIACSCKAPVWTAWRSGDEAGRAEHAVVNVSHYVLLALVVLRHVLRIAGRALLGLCIPLPILALPRSQSRNMR